MSDFSLDFTNVTGGDFDAIPSGVYNVALTDWSRTEVKNEGGKLPVGTPGINWEFTVQDGEYENRKLWTNHWFHERTLGFIKGLLKATGKFDDDDLSGELDLDPDALIGSQLRAVVGQRNYQGEARNEIKRFKPAGEGGETSSPMLP